MKPCHTNDAQNASNVGEKGQSPHLAVARQSKAAAPDLSGDLAALHIAREPERRTRRWVSGLLLLILAGAGSADRQKATVLVRIAFNALDPRILPDMGIKVTFLREADDDNAPAAQAITLVPKSAVRTENGVSYAFVVRQNTVERRVVQTGGTDGDRLEVRAELKGGDRVVLSPPSDLAEGTPIVVKQ